MLFGLIRLDVKFHKCEDLHVFRILFVIGVYDRVTGPSISLAYVRHCFQSFLWHLVDTEFFKNTVEKKIEPWLVRIWSQHGNWENFMKTLYSADGGIWTFSEMLHLCNI